MPAQPEGAERDGPPWVCSFRRVHHGRPRVPGGPEGLLGSQDGVHSRSSACVDGRLGAGPRAGLRLRWPKDLAFPDAHPDLEAIEVGRLVVPMPHRVEQGLVEDLAGRLDHPRVDHLASLGHGQLHGDGSLEAELPGRFGERCRVAGDPPRSRDPGAHLDEVATLDPAAGPQRLLLCRRVVDPVEASGDLKSLSQGGVHLPHPGAEARALDAKDVSARRHGQRDQGRRPHVQTVELDRGARRLGLDPQGPRRGLQGEAKRDRRALARDLEAQLRGDEALLGHLHLADAPGHGREEERRVPHVDAVDEHGGVGRVTAVPPPPGLEIATHPTDATVFVDGVHVGNAPLFLSPVPRGVRQVKVAKEGFVPAELSLEVTGEGPPIPLRFTLQAATGTLRIESEPSRASVKLDGLDVGATPLVALPVTPGGHVLRVESAGFRPWVRKVNASLGETLQVTARLDRVDDPAAQKKALRTGGWVQRGDLVEMGPGVTAPRRISGNPAPFPEAARKLRLKGTVTVELTVTETGEVVDPRVVESAGEILDQALLDAVRHWHYEPADLNGLKVRVRIRESQVFGPPEAQPRPRARP